MSGIFDLLLYLPLWLWFCITVIGLLYLYGIWPYITTQIKLRGPKPSPFVGNVIPITKQGIITFNLANKKKYGDAFVSWAGRNPTIHVSNPDIVKQICIRDFSNFVNRPLGLPVTYIQKLTVSTLYDDHWKFVRSILTPAFSSGKMRKMVPLIQTCLDRLVQNLDSHAKSGESFEVKKLFGGLTMEVIGAVGFGIDTEVQKDLNDQFLVNAKRVFDENWITKLPVLIAFFFPFLIPVFEALNLTADNPEVTNFFIKMLSKTIKERRQNPSSRKDLLQLMIDSSLDDLSDEDGDIDTQALKMKTTKKDKKLNDDEVIAQAIIFLLAGFETTASALTFLAYNLAIHPEIQEKLITEIDETLAGAPPTYDNVMKLPYLEMCLAETQRLYPAVDGTLRVAAKDTVIEGVYIPANCRVLLMGYALQHDERYFPDPEKFDPNRFSSEEKEKRNPYVYFPFGVGPRNCVGMRLAKMEAKMAAVTVLQRYRFKRAPETEVPLILKKGNFVQAENGIWLKLEPRN